MLEIQACAVFCLFGLCLFNSIIKYDGDNDNIYTFIGHSLYAMLSMSAVLLSFFLSLTTILRGRNRLTDNGNQGLM